MKKLLILTAVFCFCFQFSNAQEQRYLVFEFIRVDKGKTVDYLEYKDFLSKIYAQAVADGDIVGWDLWSLKSGSELDSYQYATVTYFKDPVKMMKSNDPEVLINYAKAAYPDMNESQITSRIKASLADRDLAIRSFMVEIARTSDSFRFQPGTLASFDLMKAVEGNFEEYEAAEKEVFLPLHEKKIKAGLMESWSLLRTALPTGSQASSTHLTMNIYKDYLQFFNSLEYEDMEMTATMQEKVEKGLKSRDQKWVHLATLETMVR